MTERHVPAAGSCLCGLVRFAIEPPYRAFQYCHCSRCRKTSGSAHGANLFVAIDQFRWTSGEEHARRFELESSETYCTGFCVRCGSRIPWITRSGSWAIVPAGSLDTDPGMRPTRSVHVASRGPWFVPTADLPAFDEEPR